jgi:hypothetical protein
MTNETLHFLKILDRNHFLSFDLPVKFQQQGEILKEKIQCNESSLGRQLIGSK